MENYRDKPFEADPIRSSELRGISETSTDLLLRKYFEDAATLRDQLTLKLQFDDVRYTEDYAWAIYAEDVEPGSFEANNEVHDEQTLVMVFLLGSEKFIRIVRNERIDHEDALASITYDFVLDHKQNSQLAISSFLVSEPELSSEFSAMFLYDALTNQIRISGPIRQFYPMRIGVSNCEKPESSELIFPFGDTHDFHDDIYALHFGTQMYRKIESLPLLHAK